MKKKFSARLKNGLLKLTAFTLVETLTIIFILVLLLTCGGVIYNGIRIRINDAKRVLTYRRVAMAVEAFRKDNGFYPGTLTPGGSLVGNNGNIYLPVIPADFPHTGNSDCPNGFQYINLGDSYQIIFCIDSPVNNLQPGGVVIKPALPPANVSPIKGLVGYWLFDEGQGVKAYDYSGYNNNGTWHGSGTQHYDTGFNGTPVGQFNGTDDFIKIISSPLLNADSLTIALWVMPDEITGHNYILEKGAPSQFGASLENGKRHGELEFFLDDSRTCSDKTRIYQSKGGIKTDTWNFLAFSYDAATSLLKIYINGQLYSKFVYDGCTPINDGDMYIARKIDSNQGYEYGGLMDNVSFYNRALTDAEILSVYNASK